MAYVYSLTLQKGNNLVALESETQYFHGNIVRCVERKNMKLWKGIVEVTETKRYHCTVRADSREEAQLKLESSMNETETTYPCECGCNHGSPLGTRKAHTIQLVREIPELRTIFDVKCRVNGRKWGSGRHYNRPFEIYDEQSSD